MNYFNHDKQKKLLINHLIDSIIFHIEEFLK